MTNRLGRLDPESGASVNPKTHKLCLEARDYLGCVKAMDGYAPPSKSYSRNEIESPFSQTKTLPSTKKRRKLLVATEALRHLDVLAITKDKDSEN